MSHDTRPFRQQQLQPAAAENAAPEYDMSDAVVSCSTTHHIRERAGMHTTAYMRAYLASMKFGADDDGAVSSVLHSICAQHEQEQSIEDVFLLRHNELVQRCNRVRPTVRRMHAALTSIQLTGKSRSKVLDGKDTQEVHTVLSVFLCMQNRIRAMRNGVSQSRRRSTMLRNRFRSIVSSITAGDGADSAITSPAATVAAPPPPPP